MITCFTAAPPNDIRRVIYATGKAIESLPRLQYRSTISVVPNVSYSISVEILHDQTTRPAQKVSKIIVGNQNLGKCETGDTNADCTFLLCSNINDGGQTAVSENGEIDVNIEFEGHSTGCHCDTNSWMCSEIQKSQKQAPIVAAVRIILKKQYRLNTENFF